MKSRKSWPLSTLVFLLPACGQQLVEFPNPSQGTADAGIPDVPLVDAAAMEAPVFDVTTSDTSEASSDSNGNLNPRPAAFRMTWKHIQHTNKGTLHDESIDDVVSGSRLGGL